MMVYIKTHFRDTPYMFRY